MYNAFYLSSNPLRSIFLIREVELESKLKDPEWYH